MRPTSGHFEIFLLIEVVQYVAGMSILTLSTAAHAQNANVQWAVGAGDHVHPNAIAVDTTGNSYVTGFYQFAGNFGSVTLNNITSRNSFFVAAYDALGNLRWARKANATSASSYSLGTDIGVDTSGNI